MITTIGYGLVWLGILIIAIGVLGTYRFNNFYPRILAAALIDTMGNITVLIGVMMIKGLSFFTLKVGIILLIMLVINPLSTHSIARSAYFSGYKVRKEQE
jgi:multicomponent Na+:H+ antiporter subunit G